MSKLDISFATYQDTALHDGGQAKGIIGARTGSFPYGLQSSPNTAIYLMSGTMPTQQELEEGVYPKSPNYDNGTWSSQILAYVKPTTYNNTTTDSFDNVVQDGSVYLRMFNSLTTNVDQSGTATWFLMTPSRSSQTENSNAFVGDITTPDALTPGALVMENPVLEVGQQVNIGPILIKIPNVFTW